MGGVPTRCARRAASSSSPAVWHVSTSSARPDRPGGMRFFDCGALDDDIIAAIVVQEEEISEYRLEEMGRALELLSGPLRPQASGPVWGRPVPSISKREGRSTQWPRGPAPPGSAGGTSEHRLSCGGCRPRTGSPASGRPAFPMAGPRRHCMKESNLSWDSHTSTTHQPCSVAPATLLMMPGGPARRHP